MTKREEGLLLVSEWRESGLSKKEFCASKSIGVHRLSYWLSRESELGALNLGFFKLPRQQTAPRGELRVHYPNGVKIECAVDLALVRRIRPTNYIV